MNMLKMLPIILIIILGFSTRIEAYTTQDIECLALNIYWEARSESIDGQYAVGAVVLNRVKDTRFPNTICEIVYQGPIYKSKPELPVRNRCQFSWYCDGKNDNPRNRTAYSVAVTIAETLLKMKNDIIDGATHYHASYILPEWAKTKTKIIQIDNHIFYRWEK